MPLDLSLDEKSLVLVSNSGKQDIVAVVPIPNHNVISPAAFGPLSFDAVQLNEVLRGEFAISQPWQRPVAHA